LAAPGDIKNLPKFPGNISVIKESAGKYSIQEHLTIPAKLRKLKVDLYHSPHYVVPLVKTKPTLTVISDLIHLRFKANLKRAGAYNYAKFMIKHALKSSDCIVTISQWSKTDILQLCNFQKSDINVIYGAVDDRFQKITDDAILRAVFEKVDIPDQYILYTGSFKEHKNIARLIQAFSRLKRKQCPFLILAGDRIEKYKHLQALINELDLQKNIINPGWLNLEEFIALYSGAAAFVFPSLYEGFGLSPLEAMKCRTPVVSSDAACMPEILGEAALYFDPYSVEDMAGKIRDVLGDNKLRRALIEEGAAQVQKYSWRRSANKYLELYENI
jgi:glycosyltransferase involved in cell wall biosynthesis